MSIKSLIGSFVLELEADGDAKAVIKGEKSSGDWEEVENGFKLKDSQDEMAFTKVKKGVVKTEYSGMVILFEKQASK